MHAEHDRMIHQTRLGAAAGQIEQPRFWFMSPSKFPAESRISLPVEALDLIPLSYLLKGKYRMAFV